MSAYICSEPHFKALAMFAVAREHGSIRVDPRYIPGAQPPAEWVSYNDRSALATYYANVLYMENIRSVAKRYRNEPLQDLPGPHEKPEHIAVTDRELPRFEVYSKLAPVDILKMCAGLEYQSCETDDYQSTLAYRLLHHIRLAAIKALPGYDAGPWDYEGPPEGSDAATAVVIDLSTLAKRKK